MLTLANTPKNQLRIFDRFADSIKSKSLIHSLNPKPNYRFISIKRNINPKNINCFINTQNSFGSRIGLNCFGNYRFKHTSLHESDNNSPKNTFNNIQNETNGIESSLDESLIDTSRFDVASAEMLNNSSPFLIELTKALLETLHNGWELFGHQIGGMPWWGTIMVSAVVLRSLTTLPIAIYQQRATARVKALEPLIQGFGSLSNSANQIQNIHPDSVQLLNEMSNGGILWFSDLLTIDHTHTLPLIVTSLYLVNIEINQYHIRKLGAKQSKMRKALVNVFRGVSLIMLPISLNAPVVSTQLVLDFISAL
ncbi:hypothetical protein BB559_003610 [Furculomyces boomerangus]|uniref:Uncharacterized protein n=1 Tax=Furculomyces boomerangus TaxID=61424 RepID=A0A2T9YK95_9FUNG|nr:hypothetical protein BB559_003610 [Furculomyces boomerangus]